MTYDDVFPLPAGWRTETDHMLADSVARTVERDVHARRLDLRESFDELLWPAYRRLAVELGLQAMAWPADQGGSDVHGAEAATTVAAVLEQIAAADVGLGVAFANLWAMQATFAFGAARDAEAMARRRDVFCGDAPVVVSLVLPDYDGHGGAARELGGLAYPVKATAKGEGVVLEGRGVRPQIAARDAAQFVVPAGRDGRIVLYLVPGDAPGLTRGEEIKKTGLAFSRNGDLAFHGVAVTGECELGAGAEAWRRLLGWYHLGVAAVCVGASFSAWRIVKNWGETRVIKGKGQVFKENPLVAALLGRIGGDITTHRLLVHGLARLLAADTLDAAAGATATATVRRVARASVEVFDAAMELMASAGYATEWELERYWRDLKTVETLLGPATAGEIAVARHVFDLQTL